MPRMMRSPPQSSPNSCALVKTQSEPDLSPIASTSAACAQLDSVNVTTRPSNKRFRGDDSYLDSDRFEELKSMLMAWKVDQDTILNKLVTEVSELKQKNNLLENANLEMEKSMQMLSQKYEDMKTRLNVLEEQHKESEKHLQNLSTQGSVQVIAQLEVKIDSMDQQARNSNIEICNLPEKRSENLFSIVETIGSVVKYPVTQSDIISIHRVPHAQQNDIKPKNIIVKLKSQIVRNNFLSACRKYKSLKSDQLGVSGASQSVYFNEHLTLKNKTLFREARQAAKKNGYKYVWIKNATVLVRAEDGTSAFAIRSVADLKKIVAKQKTIAVTPAC